MQEVILEINYIIVRKIILLTALLILRIPRLTQAERDAIASPATALIICQTDIAPGFYYYNGSSWKSLTDLVPEV